MNEQDAPAGPGLNTISLPLQFDDSSAPAVDDLSGTVFVLTVPAPISLNPVPGGTVDTPYAETIAASGGTGSITLAVSNVTGSIPGLSIPTGGTNSLTITGTPTAAGNGQLHRGGHRQRGPCRVAELHPGGDPGRSLAVHDLPGPRQRRARVGRRRSR